MFKNLTTYLKHLILFFILFLTFNLTTLSQQNKTQENHRKEKNDSLKTAKTIEDILYEKSKDSKIYKQLDKWLVISQKSNIKNPTNTNIEIDNNSDLTHTIIKNIEIIQASCFAGNIMETEKKYHNKLEEKLDNFRFPTKKSIILNSLFFHKGDMVNLQNIKDSERLLRSHNYITDAKIILEATNEDSTMTNVYIFIQDKYPYGGNIKFSQNNVNLELFSKNVLGYGLELRHIISTAPTENHVFGFGEKLTWDDIYGTYVNFTSHLYKTENSNQFNIKLHKEFYKPEIKYAGGFDLTKNYQTPGISYENDIINNNLDYFHQEYWVGKSILIPAMNYFYRSNVCFMAQSVINNYYNLPDTIKDIQEYTTNYSFFGGIAFYKENFYKNNSIYSFGETEDVPYGFLTNITFGYNINEITERFYLGAHFSFGKAIIPNNGYYSFSSDFQSFINNYEPNSAIFKIGNQYISKLFKLHSYKLRSFIQLNYVKGINLNKYKLLYLKENPSGIAMYQKNTLRGNEKLVLQTENILFTPKDLMGFKIAAFNFFDIGWITQDKPILITKPYYSIGVGLRIKNEHLVLKTIQLRLAYFPRIPPDASNFNFRISGIETSSFNQFSYEKPYIDVYY